VGYCIEEKETRLTGVFFVYNNHNSLRPLHLDYKKILNVIEVASSPNPWALGIVSLDMEVMSR